MQRENKFSYKIGKSHYKNTLQLQCLSQFIRHLIPQERPVIIVCIGTDRSTGDSLGPLTGTMISHRNIKNVTVYGTLDRPVNAENLESIMKHIHSTTDHPFIIGVDSGLGRRTSVGMIYADNKPIKPGIAVNHKLSLVGDVGITAIVNIANSINHIVLQNTRLNLVLQMASAIDECLSEALQEDEIIRIG